MLVYSDPKEGAQHGYNFDGWAEGAFFYTGEGQVGDQRMTNGNKAIYEHAERGRVLRVFEAADGPARAGGKQHRYLGAFHIDPRRPFRREDAPDRLGHMRSVIVFELRPNQEETPPATLSALPAPAEEAITELVEPELNVVTVFPVSAREQGEGERREAMLMLALEEQLRAQGHTARRFRVRPPGSASSMVTDTYDATTGCLYEVKATSDRTAVRMALGQLLDYRRHLPDVRECAILLPERPADDLVVVAHDVGDTGGEA